jgi:cellulose synthase/poly-beta-1,6-N-acetylglucosamine synthase-like glycosyltransferase
MYRGRRRGARQYRPWHARNRSRLPLAALLGFVGALAFLLLPYAHFTYGYWVSTTHLDLTRDLVLLMAALWLLGRPIAVLLSGRRRVTLPQVPVHGVSAVVPVHNAIHKIDRTVQSLLAQTHRPMEIILVENNSTDETWGKLCELEREYPEVRCFSVEIEPGEYGASVAINHGVLQARHDIILRLDDDTYVSPTAIERGIAPLVSDQAVAVACNLRVANPEASLWTRLQSMEYLLAMELDRRSQQLVESVLCCSGGMALFDRQTVIETGGFVSLPREVSEDMDMTLKCHRRGKVAIAPEAIGYTQVPEKLVDVARQRFRWAISGTVSLYLHRAGLLNRRYWHQRESRLQGMMGFLGLPYRAGVFLRDLFGLLLPIDLALLAARDGQAWFWGLVLAHMALTMLQLAIIGPVVFERQGLNRWWLVPFFTLVYGPVLIGVRCFGTWAGIRHVYLLRRKQDRVRAAGMDSELIRLPESPPVLADIRLVPGVAYQGLEWLAVLSTG